MKLSDVLSYKIIKNNNMANDLIISPNSVQQITPLDEFHWSERGITKDGNVPNIIDFKKSQEPKVGYVYIRKGSSYMELIKLTQYVERCDEKNSDYVHRYFVCANYNLETKSWEKSSSGKNIADIKEYYTLVLNDYELLIEQANKAYKGELNLSEIVGNTEESLETGLVTTKYSKDQLYSLADVAADKKNKLSEIKSVINLLIEQEKERIGVIIRNMESAVGIFQKQIQEIMKVIQYIELYYGINEELFQITKGENAPLEEPISVRQMILYMDEEVAISDIYGHVKEGFDFNNVDDFNNWLLDPENRDRIIPEKRAVVVLKPRRHDKNYRDNFSNATLNPYNKTTYLLIRNGDNLYCINSDNLFIYGQVFPNKSEIEKLMFDLNNSNSSYDKQNTENKIESLTDRGKTFALIVQGLVDRSDVFKPIQPGTNIFKENVLNFIYDQENIISDGRLSWKEYHKEINSSIKRGSRIALSDSMQTQWDRYDNKRRFIKQYVDYPDMPTSGIYEVDTFKDEIYRNNEIINRERFIIKYYAGGQYYKFGEGYVDRTTRVSFVVEKDDFFVLNYDMLCVEDIDYYLNSRVNREGYEKMIPLLKMVRNMLPTEMLSEKEFIKMLYSDVKKMGVNESKINDIIVETISWWKYKNIWKRPITKDNVLAYRMIIKQIKHIIKN